LVAIYDLQVPCRDILADRTRVATDEEAKAALQEFFNAVCENDGPAELQRIFECFWLQAHAGDSQPPQLGRRPFFAGHKLNGGDGLKLPETADASTKADAATAR
jgi:hypothetical protein